MGDREEPTSILGIIFLMALLLTFIFMGIAFSSGEDREFEVACYDRLDNPINGLTCTETIFCTDTFLKFLNNVGCENK